MDLNVLVPIGLDESQLLVTLVDRYGVMMGSASLAKALGFTSVNTFRQACWRGNIGFPMFAIPGRAGRFALTHDVVRWLWTLRQRGYVGRGKEDGHQGESA